MGKVINLQRVRADRAEEARQFNGGAIVGVAICILPGIACWVLAAWIMWG